MDASQNSPLSFLSGLHRAVNPVFSKLGFRYELHNENSNGLSLGFWRKNWESSLGSKNRFVLLPGFGDTPLSWVQVLFHLRPVLKRHFSEVVVIDYPGFLGFGSNLPAFNDMDLLMGAATQALVELEPHTVLGHSLGGWLAASYASGMQLQAKKNAPVKLLLANPSGVLIGEEKREQWRARFEDAKSVGIKAFRRHIFGKEPLWFPLFAPDFHRFLFKKEVVSFMDSIREDHLLNDKLKGITSDVWLLWGEKDSLVPVAWAHDWLAEFESGRVGYVLGAGHSPHVEKPMTFASLIAKAVSDEESKDLRYRLLKRYWQIGLPAEG